MLPAFVKRHFEDEAGHSDFRVAVVNRDEPTQIIFESEPGAAAVALDRPDASTQLMSMHERPFFMVTRGGSGGPGPALGFGPGSGRFEQALPQPPEAAAPPGDRRLMVDVIETHRDDRNATIRTRILGTGAGPDGQWRLVAKHRAGSLEAAVTTARTRNFALSSGVLLLLSAAIGLILVSARRADRLGRQQMEFVATVSHELRTPVSVIGAAAGNLADGVVADPARVRQYGETIQTEARRLAETVERVLQLAGIASGRSMSAVTMSPATLIDDALTACHAEIEAAGFEVDMDVPDRLPLIAGDRTALRSAMQNLIGNAVKYGRDAQWLSISARATAAANGAASARGGRGFVEITIADRGPGIPDDDRAHIFEAFYRGRHAISHQIHGNGLGLHLVQRIVEAHGGRVSVNCDAAPGCRFTFALPAVQPPVAHGASGDLLHDDAPGHTALQPGQSL
jgi:signal transduction histidine kinase